MGVVANSSVATIFQTVLDERKCAHKAVGSSRPSAPGKRTRKGRVSTNEKKKKKKIQPTS